MSQYIVRVIGYDAYWTGEGDVSWTNIIEDAKVFDSLEEAQGVVNAGRHMEAVELESAQEQYGGFTTPVDFIEQENIKAEEFIDPNSFDE